MKDKRTSLKEAVVTCIADGDSVVLGACLESDIPFAVTYELIRQGKRNLRMIAPISDASTDMLIGAGVASGVIGAWVGNVSGGLGHNYRRAIEAGIPQKVTIEDYSNFTLGMALTAGAYGMPYIPVRSILGSDITKSNPNFRLACDPFTNQPVIQVPPLKPDVAVFSVQRADNNGNCHHWGSAGVMQEAGMAAKKIILLADEIVEHEVIASDPSRVPFPGFLVTAVVHEPSGQHPSPMTGTWKRDNQFFNDYHAQSRDRVGFAAWLDEWVFACSDHGAYRAKLGEKLEELRIRGQALAAPANYAAK